MIEDRTIREWFSKSPDSENNKITKILNVEYAHVRLDSGDELYFTKYGLPFLENLKPENFYTDKEWFKKYSLRLSGTSCLYRVRTKKINNRYKDIVIKWNRMGQDIPGAEEAEELDGAKFNSPFEEFSLVMDLRREMFGLSEPAGIIKIQKPLAIFIPAEVIELWRFGRKEYVMRSIIQSHREVALDMYRSYAVIYEWIPGIDTAQAFKGGLLARENMVSLTREAHNKLADNGFIVRDSKPHHVIVRPRPDGRLQQDKNGNVWYGLIDFELLEKTSRKDEADKKAKRLDYHKRQRDRFVIDIPKKFHPHLKHTKVFNTEYVFGQSESMKGRLWVVGRDPYLFDYFLPEKWKKAPKSVISMFSESYYTISKDKLHLVWEVSKVGFRPDMDPFKEAEKRVLEFGYNSPFEEVSLAIELSKRGIATIYPRAIYMPWDEMEISEAISDKSRYATHQGEVAPDGLPVLLTGHKYIIIWGYWNGPDEKLADEDENYYEGINALNALRDSIITEDMYISLLRETKRKLHKIGVEDLNYQGNHLLISLDSNGTLLTDKKGRPEVRLCNFEFLKKIK